MEKKANIDLLRKEVNSFDGNGGSGDIPYDVVKLPSKGLVYPDGHPLCGETEVAFKPMTAQQENILASRALIKKGTVLSVLIKSCLANASIDPTSLLIGDKSALLLAIRISGFGPEYRVLTRCPECGEEFHHSFDLSQCQLKELGDEPVKPCSNLFEFALPVSKKIIQFSLLTDADDLDIMKTQQNRAKIIQSDIETRVTDELSKMIKVVDGSDDREKVNKFIQRMNVRDSRAFRQHIARIQPGVDMEEEVTCRKCGTTETHKIPLTTEFFWPSL